jgi:glutamate synthase (NADPH/NADH) small chain
MEQTPEQLSNAAKEIWARISPTLQNMSMKDRLAIPRQEMPSQAPEVRRHNTAEVALGFTVEQALVEANRCLQCKNQPCTEGCPVKLPIRDFVGKIAKGDFAAAIALIKQHSLLPAVCGRVCPQEMQCQAHCTVGKTLKSVDSAVSIGRLERFVADWERAKGATLPSVKPETGKKVAIIGSGPSGLVAAADVRREGHDVTVFDALHKFGGVMLYGIPEFRLPKAIVASEVATLEAIGVHFVPNFLVGRTRTLQDLLEKDGFDAVYVGTGAGLPHFMNIEGENLVGVFAANEYLTRANLMRAYERGRAATPIAESKKVVVLGGGNVAMDAARTALRLGAEKVYIVYRRSMEELPARKEEVEHAQEEGIDFRLLNNPVEILGYNNPDDPRDPKNGFVTGIKCIRMELGEPDASGRRRPVEVPDSEFVLDVDTVIMSIGTSPNPLIKDTTKGLEVNSHGGIIVNEDGLTSRDAVYAGGDAVTGAATVISAMGAGKLAAKSIDEYLSKK